MVHIETKEILEKLKTPYETFQKIENNFPAPTALYEEGTRHLIELTKFLNKYFPQSVDK